MFSLHSHCRLFQEKRCLLRGQRSRHLGADVVEALKSEVVRVLVDSWLLPVKGGIIEQTDQPQRRQRLAHSDRTVILPFEPPVVWERKDHD